MNCSCRWSQNGNRTSLCIPLTTLWAPKSFRELVLVRSWQCSYIEWFYNWKNRWQKHRLVRISLIEALALMIEVRYFYTQFKTFLTIICQENKKMTKNGKRLILHASDEISNRVPNWDWEIRIVLLTPAANKQFSWASSMAYTIFSNSPWNNSFYS